MLQKGLSLILLGLLVGVDSRTPVFQPDLYEPVQRIINITSGFNLTLTVELVLDLLRLIDSCTESSAGIVLDSALPLMEETLLYFGPEEFDLEDIDLYGTIENLTIYMNTTDFARIHSYLWNEDEEWNDMIELFYNAGWNGENSIYNNFRKLYDFFECNLDIPEGPRPPTAKNQRSKRSARNIQQFELNPIIDFPEGCDPFELVVVIIKVLLSKPAILLNYINRQVNVNPSIHLFWAKLSEPAKGQSFRAFRSLPEFKCATNHMWLNILRPTMDAIVYVIKESLMIDFDALGINLIDLVISFVEYSIWKTPFPYPSTTELICPVNANSFE